MSKKTIIFVLLVLGSVIAVFFLFRDMDSINYDDRRADILEIADVSEISVDYDDDRRADILEIADALEISHRDNGQYPVLASMPSSIDPYMAVVPTDPESGTRYQWLSNVDNSQSFCVYTILARGDLFAVNPSGSGGSFSKPESPSSLEDCESVISTWIGVYDDGRRVDITIIGNGMQLYYNDNGEYPISSLMPNAIEPYLVETPTERISDHREYEWISNINNPQSFCVYAILGKGGFYVSNSLNPGGRNGGESTIEPSSLEECELLQLL